MQKNERAEERERTFAQLRPVQGRSIDVFPVHDGLLRTQNHHTDVIVFRDVIKLQNILKVLSYRDEFSCELHVQA